MADSTAGRCDVWPWDFNRRSLLPALRGVYGHLGEVGTAVPVPETGTTSAGHEAVVRTVRRWYRRTWWAVEVYEVQTAVYTLQAPPAAAGSPLPGIGSGRGLARPPRAG